MKIFACPTCGNKVFFENYYCDNCNSVIAFAPSIMGFKALPRDEEGAVKDEREKSFRNCKNREFNLCNWLVENGGDLFCTACQLNRKVPNLQGTDNFEKWNFLERAKHRLIFQLLRLNLPVLSRMADSEKGLAFDFLSTNNSDGVLTGHANGVITIILSEADSVHREQLRKQMSEPYRTLLGHFRHEIGHYYWPVLVKGEALDEYRHLFGDERLDYGEALNDYYQNGAPEKWRKNYISKYASAHSWEDWAETWAHYLHLMDTLETANSMKISIDQQDASNSNARISDPYAIKDFQVIYERSVDLFCAANSLNRSMGLPDIYPFVISETVQR